MGVTLSPVTLSQELSVQLITIMITIILCAAVDKLRIGNPDRNTQKTRKVLLLL